MTTRIKLRRDTAANWTSNDPILALGEAGYDTTNNELRVGDGTSVWSALSAMGGGGTGNKITAEKTYSVNHSDGSGQTFTYTTGSIAVQFASNDGLYLDDLLGRLAEYFDGSLQFPYNYSNVSLVINPGTTNLSTTVTNVTFPQGDPPLYTITLATTNPGPIAIDEIEFNYNYINTVGLDTVNDFFGMATGDDDIDIRSGRDIDLVAADDFSISARNNFELTLVNRDTMSDDQGIEITTQTTTTNKTWTFRLDGNLELPEGLTLPNKTNTGYAWDYALNGPTLQLSNDSQNQVIVTGPPSTEANPYSQRIVIQGQRGYGTWNTSTVGEGGDVYIWGGSGGEGSGVQGGSGGDIKVRGGQGQDNAGGYVKIEGGDAVHWGGDYGGYGGYVEITGGDVTNSGYAGNRGGDIRITGGRAYATSTQSGVVQVITGGISNGNIVGDKIWTFGNDGSLSLPANTVSTATTTGGVIKIKGSVRTLPGDIPNYGIPGTSSILTTATDIVIWTADSILVTAAKITLRVGYYNSGAGGWDNTEIIELLITKTNPGQGSSSSDGNIAVIGQVKTNAGYADSTVDWDTDGDGRLVLLSTPDPTKAADCNIYWNYDVVAFEHTID